MMMMMNVPGGLDYWRGCVPNFCSVLSAARVLWIFWKYLGSEIYDDAVMCVPGNFAQQSVTGVMCVREMKYQKDGVLFLKPTNV